MWLPSVSGSGRRVRQLPSVSMMWRVPAQSYFRIGREQYQDEEDEGKVSHPSPVLSSEKLVNSSESVSHFST